MHPAGVVGAVSAIVGTIAVASNAVVADAVAGSGINADEDVASAVVIIDAEVADGATYPAAAEADFEVAYVAAATVLSAAVGESSVTRNDGVAAPLLVEDVTTAAADLPANDVAQAVDGMIDSTSGEVIAADTVSELAAAAARDRVVAADASLVAVE